MLVGVLGPLEVTSGGVAVRLTREQERRALVALVVRARQGASVHVLADALWPGEAQQPAHPARTVRTIVSRLRRALGADVIATTPVGYRLDLQPDAIDAARFERSVGEARGVLQTAPEPALALLDEALSLWRGNAYGEFADEPFAQAAAGTLEELRIAAIAARAQARLALGRHEGLVEELHAIVADNPFSEKLREHLAVALYRSGRQADALGSLAAYRRLAAEELGLDPSPAIRELEHRILTHRLEALDPAADRPHPRPAARPRGEVVAPADLTLATTPLIGRDPQIEQVLDSLGRGRLVMLTGPGGVGKTRLAAEVAARLSARFADGSSACSLAHIRDAESVPAYVATQLHIRQHHHRTVEESLIDVLRARHLLLVLDNCEHVVGAAAPLAAALLRGCPQLTILATSRERLGLSDEQLIEVPPLRIPDDALPDATGTAVELFVDRARAAGGRVTPGERGVVAELCRRLDGLPLAIELAAAHVRTLRPAEIIDRLGRSDALRPRFRDLADRHRSLQAVTAWSYDLLEDDERALFAGLSVFAGPFDLESAEAVAAGAGAGEEGDVAALLFSLVDKSMVTVRRESGPADYVLLETLRSFGRERLVESGVERRWRDAHARHHLRLAQQADRELTGPGERAAVDRLRRALDNIREARRWSLEHDIDLAVRIVAAVSWFRYRTVQAELELWAEETARLAPDHEQAPTLLGSAALGAWARGELVRARRLAVQATSGSGRGEQRLGRDALAAICLVEGDLPDALHHFDHAVVLARAADDAYHEAWCLASRSVVLGYLGRHAERNACLAEAQAIADSLRCPSLHGWLLYARGEGLLESDPDGALELLEQGEGLGREAGHEFVETVAGISAITVRMRRGEVSVLSRFRELVQHLGRLGNRTQLWTMLRSLVVMLAGAGRFEEAAVLLAALEASTTAPEPYGPDFDRLDETRRLVSSNATASVLEAWTARGRALDDDGAISYALASADALGSAVALTP